MWIVNIFKLKIYLRPTEANILIWTLTQIVIQLAEQDTEVTLPIVKYHFSLAISPSGVR